MLILLFTNILSEKVDHTEVYIGDTKIDYGSNENDNYIGPFNIEETLAMLDINLNEPQDVDGGDQTPPIWSI